MGFYISLLLLIVAADNSDEVNETIQMTTSEKLAPYASLLLPGTGELMRGYRIKGEVFLWSDLLAMGGVAGFGWSAASQKNAATGLAILNADANPDNRSNKYLRALENYMSIDDYNQSIAREARTKYPDDLSQQTHYISTYSLSAEDAWSWETDSLRLEYLNYRNQMRAAWQVTQSLLGVMVLTRVLSFFDVALLSPPQSSRFGVLPVPDPQAPGLKVTYRF